MNQAVNPFVVNGRIDRKYFCDRKKESAQLLRYILNGNNSVLISPRRMGKTGLIKYCFDDESVKDHYITVFVDVLQTNTMKEFTFLLGKAVFSELRPHRLLLDKFIQTLKSLTGKFGYDPVSGVPSFDISIGDISKPEYTLEEIFRWIENADTSVIVAIDEFQQVAKYSESNAEAILRTFIQHTTRASFIFAGSQRHMLQRMFADSTRPFYNSASLMHLDAIPLVEYKSFVEKMFINGGRNVDTDTIDMVYDMVEGNTFYMQKIFNLSYAMVPFGETCKSQTIEEAIEELYASYDTIFREMLSRLTETQKALLVAIARHKRVVGVTSGAFIRENALSSASVVQNALKKLMDYEYLIRDENAYSISDKFLRLWLLRTY